MIMRLFALYFRFCFFIFMNLTVASYAMIEKYKRTEEYGPILPLEIINHVFEASEPRERSKIIFLCKDYYQFFYKYSELYAIQNAFCDARFYEKIVLKWNTKKKVKKIKNDKIVKKRINKLNQILTCKFSVKNSPLYEAAFLSLLSFLCLQHNIKRKVKQQHQGWQIQKFMIPKQKGICKSAKQSLKYIYLYYLPSLSKIGEIIYYAAENNIPFILLRHYDFLKDLFGPLNDIIQHARYKGIISIENGDYATLIGAAMRYKLATPQEIHDFLSDNPLYISFPQKDGYAPLHIAGELGRYDFIKTLLTLHADPNILTNDRDTCLTFLFTSTKTCKEIKEIAALLLSYGFDPNIQNRLGQVPLHYLYLKVNEREDCLDLLNFLMSHGASITISDWIGSTPLHSLSFADSGFLVHSTSLIRRNK